MSICSGKDTGHEAAKRQHIAETSLTRCVQCMCAYTCVYMDVHVRTDVRMYDVCICMYYSFSHKLSLSLVYMHGCKDVRISV